jgi:hypothetical protein
MVAQADADDGFGMPNSPDVHRVAVADLSPGESPRQGGLNEAHVARLAECVAGLPPILVDRKTMKVIDGMHRLSAAKRTGRELIDVMFFDGGTQEAFILAVELNIRHGLPLSLRDRKAAARRILAASSGLSDRTIAFKTGLSDKTVAMIRACSGAEIPHADTRKGRDGRVYPVNGAEVRRLLMQAVADRPDAPLREIASAFGVSPTTVRNARKRLSISGDSVHTGEPSGSNGALNADDRPALISPKSTVRTARQTTAARYAEDIDIKEALDRLCADPSVRGKEAGRELLRWLSSRAIGVGDLPEIANLPFHRKELVAMIARKSAHAWLELGRKLDADGTKSSTLAVA